MKLQLTLKHRFYENNKIFELLCIETDFPKYFAKCRNLFFVSHMTVIPRNFLYHRSNQISLKYVLHNFTKYFSGARLYEIH